MYLSYERMGGEISDKRKRRLHYVLVMQPVPLVLYSRMSCGNRFGDQCDTEFPEDFQQSTEVGSCLTG